QQIRLRSRDPQHVAVAGEDDIGPSSNCARLVDEFEWRDTHRATGAMNHPQTGRQQVVDTLPNDGVSLAAAYFHQAPRFGHGGVDFAKQLLGKNWIAVFLDVLHRVMVSSAIGPNSWANAPGIAAMISKARSASSSSRRLIAKPTCTTT